MRVESESTLASFRTPGRCEACLRWCQRRDPHHAFVKRGLGGGTRLDLAENLIGLCRPCHDRAEHLPAFNDGLQIRIALREYPSAWPVSVLPSDIKAWLCSILRAPKEGPLPPRPWGDDGSTTRQLRPLPDGHGLEF